MRVVADVRKRAAMLVSQGWSELRHRPVALALSILMLVSSIVYPIGNILDAQRYALSAEVEQLVGDVNSNLASKLRLNDEKTIYEFNGGAEEPTTSLNADPDPEAALASLRQQTGGGGKKSDNLYALDVPLNPKEGVTYYDKNLKLSFKATPQFALSSGQTDDDGRIIFPGAKGTKAVYSLKTNGLKEDLVLTRPIGDSHSFSYKLDLPKELGARLHNDGSVGIYSADPMLFGNVSFGGDEDYEKLKSARETAVKDHLVFAIPAPVIVQQGNKSHSASSKFVLNGDILTVESKGLEQLTYPISIDPSVVVTSSSDFQTGNNEGNIEYSTDEIKRGGLTGGSVGTWTTETNVLPANRNFSVTGVYNGFLYAIGGYDQETNTPFNDVAYAPINADSTLGTWTISTTQFASPRYYHAATIYNGYMYVTGGRNPAGSRFSDVQYAKINSNGSIGTWSSTTSYADNRTGGNSVAHNGYLYVLGGYTGSVYLDTVIYSPIRADGTIGAWSSTSSFSGGRTNAMVTHSGSHVYIAGGATTGYLNTVQYAKFQSDGSLTAWVSTTNLPTNLGEAYATYNAGYVYIGGGTDGTTNYSDMLYAQVNSDGSIGTWRSVGGWDFGIRHGHSLAIHNSYIYLVSGRSTSVYYKDIKKVKIHPAGMNGAGTATTSLPTIRAQGKDYGRYGHTTVVYNNNIYIIGGYANAGIATVYYAPLNANGTIGTWTSTTSLPAARYYHASVVYNGYLYVIGGYTTAHSNSVLYAPLNANGTIGTWTTNTSTFTNARSLMGAVTYNNYLYILGGYGTSFVEYSDVQYAPFNANASVGTFTTASSFATARDSHYSAVIGKYVYVVGGWDGTTNFADVQYAQLNQSGGLVGGLSSCPNGGTLTNGTWCTTTSLQTARHAHTGYVSKGCLYAIAGGIAGNTITASMEYTCANADGTLETWKSGTAPTSTQRNMASGAVHKDILYLLGGESSGQPAYFDVYYAPINQGGSGEPQAFASTTAFATARQDHSSVVANGYLYVMGGYSGSTYYNDVQYAPLNTNGTVGTWQTTNSFATARAGHTSVISNGYVYIIGGCTASTTATASAQYAPLNADGTVGTWSSTTALPAARCEQAAAAYNGHVYVMGGTDFSFVFSSVHRSTINTSTGALGSWAAMSSLDNVRDASPGAVAHNGYLYVVGGRTYNKPERMRSVEFAKINTDGSLDTWLYTSELPDSRERPGVAIHDGTLYVTGGNNGGGNVATTYYAPFVGPDGHLGRWTNSSTTFSTARLRHESVFHNGYLYVIGGYGGASLSDVQYAGVASISRAAAYSRLIDLGSVMTINSVTFNKTGDGSMTFRLAGTDGIFGASQAAGSTGGASARYVWVRAVMDDTSTTYFTDTLTQKSTVTDITVDYGAGAVTCTTDQRLRHGASFSSGTLQELGSCTQ